MTACLGPRCQDDDETARHPSVGLLCRRCWTQMEQTVAELPAVFDWLHRSLPAGGGGRGDVITGTRDKPVPIRVGVHDHRQQIQATLVSWVRLVCEERGLRGPDRSDPEATATWLGHQLDWCAGQPWVEDLSAEMRDLARDAHRLAPWQAGRHHLPAPCPNPNCGCLALVRYDGDDAVQCSECGERWAEDTYRRLAFVLASDARQRVGPVCEACWHWSCVELRGVAEAADLAAEIGRAS